MKSEKQYIIKIQTSQERTMSTLEWKNSVNEMKTAIESSNIMRPKRRKIINDRNFEITQCEEEKA